MNKIAKLLLATIALAGSHQARSDDSISVPASGKYWFDQSTTFTTFTPNGVMAIATDDLREGLHTLNAYVEKDGQISSVVSQWFLKTLNMKQGEKYKTTVFLDDKPLQTYETQTSEGGVLSLSLDMNALPLGVHTLQAQVVTPSGVATDVKTAMFMRVPSTPQLATMKGYYTIDSKIMGEIDAAMNGDIFSFDLDVSQLTAGLHSLSVYMASGLGLTTSVKTAWFVKIPLGGEGVKSYEYWINDNTASTRRVTLNEVADPFEFISLVEIGEEPFRSTSYTFAVEDGVPVTYARNNFQMRFNDSEGRITMSGKQFTDTRTRRAVTDMEQIIVNDVMLHPNPMGDNAIKWYQFEAEAGDSLALRFDRGASYELYAPDATLMIQASGADAVANRGIGLKQTGTHYIAVHDVTHGTPSMYFTHIPRFALLANTPNKASESGFFFVEVLGNSFDKLSSITLEKDGQRIVPTDMEVHDRYNLVMFFDNDKQMQTGTYNLVATYNDDGTEVVTTRSAAIDIVGKSKANVKVEVETPRIARTPYEIYVNVSNNSDQQCWGVPVNLGFSSQEGFALQFKDFYPFDVNQDNDTIPQYFITPDLFGTGDNGVFIPLIIPYIGPNETICLTIGINSRAHQKVKTYAWNSESWSNEFDEMLSDGFDFSKITELQQSNFITAKALVYFRTCAAEYPTESPLNSLTKNAPLKKQRMSVSGTAGHARDVAVATGRTLGGIENGLRLRNLNASLEAHGIDLRDETFSSLQDYQNNLKSAMPTPSSIVAEALGYGDEYEMASKYLKNCPNQSADLPTPHNVSCLQSGDPNDMHGYTAPSGDKHIGLGVKTVNYTIEFENDPEIANAPASVIRVDNTLDGKRLDLATFKPLKMIIGDKETELPSGHHFVKTLDMRPDISSVAELTFDYDATTGKATWSIRSLDPMTMEPTKYMDDGVLPVNDDSGRGTGYLVYSIDLLPDLPDGTNIDNSASIVFDDNNPIATPVWTNTTDYVLPTSTITAKTTTDNLTFDFTVEGEDSGSGIWYYDLYMRPADSKKWFLVKSQIESGQFSYTSTSSLEDADFTVLATDLAGNRQNSEMLTAMLGDADGNGTIDANDVVTIRNYYTGESDTIRSVNADVSLDGKIDTQDATATRNLYLSDQIKNKIQKTRRK